MKILQINNCHYIRGGADVVYLNTGQMLENKKHNVLYFSQKNANNLKCSSEKYFVKSIDFINSSLISRFFLILRFFYSFESASKIEKLIIENKPDIAHIHIYKGTLTPSILKVLKKYKVPVVQTLHDYGLICPHNLFIDGEGKICTRCLDKGNILNCTMHKCNRNSYILSLLSTIEYGFNSMFFPFHKYIDYFIAVSAFSLDLHSKSKRIANKITHLYNFFPGLDNLSFNPTKGDYFLFFGRLSKEKGLITLIESWSLNDRKSKLLIVGCGEFYDYCVEQAIINNSIEVLGFKTGTELKELINHASFVIVPSEWYENNPLTIIESYSSGKPVIGTNIGGITEIIVDNETGFLYKMNEIGDLDNKITLADNISQKDYIRLSTNARAFAQNNFSEGTHYESLISIYKKVIEDSKKDF